MTQKELKYAYNYVKESNYDYKKISELAKKHNLTCLEQTE